MSRAEAITYDVSISDVSGTVSVTGTVTTDGTIGVSSYLNRMQNMKKLLLATAALLFATANANAGSITIGLELDGGVIQTFSGGASLNLGNINFGLFCAERQRCNARRLSATRRA